MQTHVHYTSSALQYSVYTQHIRCQLLQMLKHCTSWIDQANGLHGCDISHDHRSSFPICEPPDITLQLQVLPGLPSIPDWQVMQVYLHSTSDKGGHCAMYTRPICTRPFAKGAEPWEEISGAKGLRQMHTTTKTSSFVASLLLAGMIAPITNLLPCTSGLPCDASMQCQQVHRSPGTSDAQ